MIITISIIAIICIICFILDKIINVKNVLASVQYPQDLSRVQISPGGPEIGANVTYLPPTNTSDSDNANVYLLISGNPGNPFFYIDFMQQIEKHCSGKVHIYAAGHAYHASLIDNDVFQQFNKVSAAQFGKKPIDSNLPRFDTQTTPTKPADFEKSSGWKDPNELEKYIVREQEGVSGSGWNMEVETLDLKEQIAHKLSLLAAIRKKHPNSKIIISGHSMGSYCWFEMIRTMERAYVYKHFGEDGLIVWDLEQNKLTFTDVENDQIPINVLHNPPKVIADFENKISRILFSPYELELWMDSLLINIQAPTTKFAPPVEIRPGTDDYQSAFAAHIGEQVTQHALSHVLQFHGLLPTIIRIANTPNGHFMTPWFFRPHILNFAVKLISRLPGYVKRVVFNIPAPFYKYPDVHIAIRLFFSQQGITNMIALAKDEMCEIRSLDIALAQRHAEKLWLYMSDVDEWAPTYQREYYQALNKYWEKQGLKKMHIQVDQDGVPHAFCFGGNIALAKHSMEYALNKHPEYLGKQ